MNQDPSGRWLKVGTTVIILLMVSVSVFLYRFLMNFDPDQMKAQLLPLEDIDLKSYEQLKK